MKSINKNTVYCSLILAGLVCSVNLAAEQVEKLTLRQETTVVSCLPGGGAGQYIYDYSAGAAMAPRCFAIDPNDFSFYIPEVDFSANMRLHKFDRTGKFITMLKSEGKADFVSRIAVASNGDIYLYCIALGSGRCIIRYDEEGKLLSRFGPQGPITNEDMKAERKAQRMYRENPIRDKYFDDLSDIFMVDKGELVAIRRSNETRTVYRFDGNSGQVVQKTNDVNELPAEIAQKIQNVEQELKEKREVLSRLHFEQKWERVCINSIIGPDGHFYYMSVKPERLEILRVTFSK